MTGKVFGDIEVLGFARIRNHKAMWACVCVCGVETEVYSHNLSKGHTTSCGCKKAEKCSAARMVHGMSSHPAYWVWTSMIDRCRNESSSSYKNYGARGIKVCAEWENSFEAFWRDMEKGYSAGLQIDRENNAEGYFKSNCNWVTPKANSNNRRSNVKVNTPAGEMNLCQAAEKYGVGEGVIRYRIRHGWKGARVFRPTKKGIAA